MFWYLVNLTRNGCSIERGWMLAADDNELVRYARTMHLGIDIEFLGKADMTAPFPTISRT